MNLLMRLGFPSPTRQSTKRLMNLIRFDIGPLHGSVQSQERPTNPLGDDASTWQPLVRLLHVALLPLLLQVLAVRR